MGRIGYIRVSTEHQETARQEALMKQYQVERIFAEKMSGKNANRPELKAMLEYVREGDTLYIESISRLRRTLIPTHRRGDSFYRYLLHSPSLNESRPYSVSVRELPLLSLKASTKAGSLLQLTGKSSGSCMSSGSWEISQLWNFRNKWGFKPTPSIVGLKNTKESIHKQERAGICRLNSFNRMSLIFEICQKPKNNLYDMIFRYVSRL